MLDVIARLETAGADTSFANDVWVDGERSLGELVGDLTSSGGSRPAVMTCLVMTPDGGDSEPLHDQPDQDDDGKHEQDDQEVRNA